MKKIILGLVLFMFGSIVYAEECTYHNSVGVDMDCTLYNELLNYYSSSFLEFMPQSEYDSIKNNNPDNIVVSTYKEELPEIFSKDAYYATTYKEIRIVKNANFVTVTLNWLQNPSVRSYDVLAVRLSSGVSINGTIAFRQISYNGGSAIISTTGSKQTFSNGQGVSFKLSTYSNLESSITFYINGTGLLYSSYQHATSSVTLNQSKNYTISSMGYGNTTLFASSVANKYDGMAGVYIPV